MVMDVLQYKQRQVTVLVVWTCINADRSGGHSCCHSLVFASFVVYEAHRRVSSNFALPSLAGTTRTISSASPNFLHFFRRKFKAFDGSCDGLCERLRILEMKHSLCLKDSDIDQVRHL